MRHWTFWNWLTYTLFALAAVLLALREGLKDWPVQAVADFVKWPIWSLLPLILIAISGVLLLARALGWIGTPAQATTVAKASSENVQASRSDPLFRDVVIEWDGSTMIFKAVALRPADNVRVFIEDGRISAGGPNGRIFELHGKHSPAPRKQIGFLEGFVRGEQISLILATVMLVQGDQQLLQWGEAKYGNVQMGVTWTTSLARIIFYTLTDQEERYPFMLVCRTTDSPGKPTVTVPHLLIEPELLTTFFES